MTKQRYSVHQSMSAIDIALVMDRHEVLGRKWIESDIGHTYKDIAIRYVLAYHGSFAFMVRMQQRYAQYNKLFASQCASILNCLTHEIETELKEAVRDEQRKVK